MAMKEREKRVDTEEEAGMSWEWNTVMMNGE